MIREIHQAVAPDEPIDVNRAPPELLRTLPGFGPRTVERLLVIRSHHRLRLRDLRRLNVVMRRAMPYFVTDDHRPKRFAGGKKDFACAAQKSRQLELLELLELGDGPHGGWASIPARAVGARATSKLLNQQGCFDGSRHNPAR